MRKRAYGPLAVGFVIVIGLLVSSAVPSGAWGHGHGGSHVFFDIGVGVPLWYPYPYAYPYPYPYPVYSPPAVVESSPPAYVQQNAPAESQPQYWYYCQGSQAYYPYVKECPGGWLQVVPQTSPAPGPPR